MPKSIHLFLFLLVTCSFLVCLYYSEIEKNVSRRLGPHLLGSNLRNLRSSEEVSPVTGALLKVTPSASVQHGEGEYQNNITQLVYHYSANSGNNSLISAEDIHLAVIFCNVGQKAALKWNFKKMSRSLIKHCSNNIVLHLHLVTDPISWEVAKEIIHHEAEKAQLNVQVRFILYFTYYLSNISSIFPDVSLLY